MTVNARWHRLLPPRGQKPGQVGADIEPGRAPLAKLILQAREKYLKLLFATSQKYVDVAALGNAFAGANPYWKGIPFEDGDVIKMLGQYLRCSQARYASAD